MSIFSSLGCWERLLYNGLGLGKVGFEVWQANYAQPFLQAVFIFSVFYFYDIPSMLLVRLMVNVELFCCLKFKVLSMSYLIGMATKLFSYRL